MFRQTMFRQTMLGHTMLGHTCGSLGGKFDFAFSGAVVPECMAKYAVP